MAAQAKVLKATRKKIFYKIFAKPSNIGSFKRYIVNPFFMTTEKCNYLKTHNTPITVKPSRYIMTRQGFYATSKTNSYLLVAKKIMFSKSGLFQFSGNKRERDLKRGRDLRR
jgi:hypothetical protein